MNYLAHAYLSFRNPDLLLGNMISDYVKGKKQFDYPPAVQQGIRLHRFIDSFTDSHEATAGMKQLFRADYRLYGGAFADVVYDHFLATDHRHFQDMALLQFSEWVYTSLEPQAAWFPERFARMFPYMKTQNWLYHYRTVEGTEQSFGGLVRRAAYLTDSRAACRIFEKNYQQLMDYYLQFFPELLAAVQQYYNEQLLPLSN